jgi:hypothetical protein
LSVIRGTMESPPSPSLIPLDEGNFSAVARAPCLDETRRLGNHLALVDCLVGPTFQSLLLHAVTVSAVPTNPLGSQETQDKFPRSALISRSTA